MKKKFKVVKTDLFKEQEKNLPKGVKKELDKVLEHLSKNPTSMLNSMSIFGKPSPEELKQWMSRTKVETIDLVLEYLSDKNCLNKKGKNLAHEFWEKYIKEETQTSDKEKDQ